MPAATWNGFDINPTEESVPLTSLYFLSDIPYEIASIARSLGDGTYTLSKGNHESHFKVADQSIYFHSWYASPMGDTCDEYLYEQDLSLSHDLPLGPAPLFA